MNNNTFLSDFCKQENFSEPKFWFKRDELNRYFCLITILTNDKEIITYECLKPAWNEQLASENAKYEIQKVLEGKINKSKNNINKHTNIFSYYE